MSRRRWVYTNKGQPLKDEHGNFAPIEVDVDFTGAERRAPVATEGIMYSGLQATDGTDVSSRKKHREYAKANNLALAGDFTNHWAAAEKQRAKEFSSDFDRNGRREDIARVLETRTRRR